MATNIVNDLLGDNIEQLKRLSDDFFEELAELQAHSPDLLIKSEPSDQTQLDDLQLSNKLELVQKSFSEVSALVNQLIPSTTNNSSSTNASKKLGLKKLVKALTPFSNGSISQSINTTKIQNDLDKKLFESVQKLEILTLLYAIIAIYQITLTELLKSTTPLSDELFYWESTLESTFNTLLYSVQTFPIRSYTLVEKVFRDLRSKVSPNVQSLQIDVPSYIAVNHPNHQNTYKLIIYYRDLILKTLYENIVANNIKGFYKVFNSKTGIFSTKQAFENISIRRYLSIMIGAPISSISLELKEKQETVKDLQKGIATSLGSITSKIPETSEVFIQRDAINTILQQYLQTIEFQIGDNYTLSSDPSKSVYLIANEILPHLKGSLSEVSISSKRPSALTRYWPTLLLSSLYGPSAVLKVITNRNEIVNFVKTNLLDTVVGFWKNWILKPVNNILSTIRHDDNSEISIMSQKSLDSDLNSLKRMVIEYTLENSPEYKNLKSTDLELLKIELDKLVSTGDLTPLMKDYENDIKQPLKNVLKGKLTRALLIQLQKTKVDGAVAINGIDKLLKSQELVFGIVAASPSLIILVYLIRGINSYLKKGYISRSSGEKKLIISKNLNNIERYLTISEDLEEGSKLDYVKGMILLELASLRKSGFYVFPKNRRSEWVRDINDLNSKKTSTKSKINTINRIYHVYGKYL